LPCPVAVCAAQKTAAEAAVNIDLRKNVSTWNAPCGYKSRELSSTARRAPMMHINKR
jgi:C4-type Zn-finger protein